MKNKKNVLGKGLGALLENYETDITTKETNGGNSELDRNFKVAGTVCNILLEQIETNPFQPRKHFDDAAIKELSVSIGKLGIIQPVTVRKLGYDKYQIISGERRLKASKIAGLREVPAFIRIANDQAMLEMALVENIQRENLNAIEIALSFQRLTDECKLTQEDLSSRIGKGRTTVSNYLRLLKLPPEIQAGIRDNKVSMGHARALINIDDADIQMAIFSEIIDDALSVRQVEELVRNIKKPNPIPRTREHTANTKEYEHIINGLSSLFDRKIELKIRNKGKGKIVIPFSSDADLETVAKMIGL